jgi:hypothetical protein
MHGGSVGLAIAQANWIGVGQTQGRGRMDREHRAYGQAPKDTYLYPLCRNAHQRLCHEPSLTQPSPSDSRMR